MKTLGRILIILSVFALVMGITYVAVNAATANSSSAAPQFNQGDRPQFAHGQRPEFPGGEPNEFRGAPGAGWMFGAIKNIAVVSIIVLLIVLPKGWLQKRRRTVQATGG
jgi:hypothetical protein